MMLAGPEDDRDPRHEVAPTRVPSGGRWRTASVVAIAVVALVAFVVAAVLPSDRPREAVSSPTPPAAAASAAPSAPVTGTASPDAQPPAPAPWVPGPPGRIALVTEDGVLEVIDDTTGVLTPVELAGRVILPASWSPDGLRLAAIVATQDSVRLEIVGPSGDVTVVDDRTDEGPFYTHWSPDGTRIAYLANDTTQRTALRTAMADGSRSSDGAKGDGMLRRGAPLYFAWAHAGQLVLHVGTGAEAFTGVVGLDGKRTGAGLPGTGDYRVAAVGRDGIAYVADGEPPAIVVARPDGTELARMPAGGPAAVAFDPAGTRLAAIGSLEPVGNGPAIPLGPLRILDPATGDVRTLVEDGAFACYWSPDGTTIAVLRLETAGGSPSAIDGGIRLAATEPTPSPAGQVEVHAVFVDAADGSVRSDRPIELAASYLQTVLPYFDQYALSHPVWSPDSRAIVLPLADRAGRTVATVLDVDGADPRPIGEAQYATWSP